MACHGIVNHPLAIAHGLVFSDLLPLRVAHHISLN
jgi:hypothetical protein